MVVFVADDPMKKVLYLLCEGIFVSPDGLDLKIQKSHKREFVALTDHARYGKFARLTLVLGENLPIEGFVVGMTRSRNRIKGLEQVFRVRVVSTAKCKIEELDVRNRYGSTTLFDGMNLNADDAIADLNQLSIRRDFSNAEVVLDAPRMADSVRRMVAA